MNNTNPKLIKRPNGKHENAVAICFFACEVRFLKRVLAEANIRGEEKKKYIELLSEGEYILDKSRGLIK